MIETLVELAATGVVATGVGFLAHKRGFHKGRQTVAPLPPKEDAVVINPYPEHVELPDGCGSHNGIHWCAGSRGHLGGHACAFCESWWPATP